MLSIDDRHGRALTEMAIPALPLTNIVQNLVEIVLPGGKTTFHSERMGPSAAQFVGRSAEGNRTDPYRGPPPGFEGS